MTTQGINRRFVTRSYGPIMAVEALILEALSLEAESL